MTTKEIDVLNNNLSQLDLLMSQIVENLNGEEISAKSLAYAMKNLCPNVSVEELLVDCDALLRGIQSGTTYAEELLKRVNNVDQQALPDAIRGEISNLSEDEKHQYLILLYQLMSEMIGKTLSPNEVVYIANADNEELLAKLDLLSAMAQADLTSDTADLIHAGISRLQEHELIAIPEHYTEAEKAWLMASAIYVDAINNQPEKIPATLIGEAVGVSNVTSRSFRNCMLSQVIPGAVAALSVAATCFLAYFAIKAVVTHSLFTTAFAWAKAHMHAKTFQFCVAGGIMYACEPAINVVKQIASTTFSATAALTCRYLKDEAQEVFENDYQQTWLLPETSQISAATVKDLENDDDITVDEDDEEFEEV